MIWLHDLSYFLGGAFLTNAVPHLVSGVMGRPFQSPFATPHGEGLSSSTVNVLWGFFNLVVGYGLTCRVGDFDLHATDQVVAAGLGVLGLIAYLLLVVVPAVTAYRHVHERVVAFALSAYVLAAFVGVGVLVGAVVVVEWPRVF